MEPAQTFLVEYLLGNSFCDLLIVEVVFNVLLIKAFGTINCEEKIIFFRFEKISTFLKLARLRQTNFKLKSCSIRKKLKNVKIKKLIAP